LAPPLSADLDLGLDLARGISLTPCSFPSAEGPQFTKGCSVNIAFQALGFCIVIGMTLWYRWENRRRDKAEGGRPPVGSALEVLDKYDLAPGFRYTH
jgi:hypothetical protein